MRRFGTPTCGKSTEVTPRVSSPQGTARQKVSTEDPAALQAARFAGFDIGGTNVRVEVVDGLGTPVFPEGRLRGARPWGERPWSEHPWGEHRIRTPKTAKRLVSEIRRMTHAVEDSLGCSVEGVGVGCAGLIDRSGAVLTSPHIPCLEDFSLAEVLAEHLERPVVVDNDVAAAAEAEMRDGCLRGVSEGLYVTVGTGIGAALISGGEILRGAHNLAGEVGHMTLPTHSAAAAASPPCRCGGSDCWESSASASALGRMRRLRTETPPGDRAAAAGVHPAEKPQGELVPELAAAGDEEAGELLDEFVARLAVGFNNLIAVLDPEVVGLGGGLFSEPLSGNFVLLRLKNALDKQSSYRGKRPSVELRRAVYGDRAGALGAALLASAPCASPLA